MSNIETIGVELGTPGYSYPSLNLWDLGLDNARIVEAVPEPKTVSLLLFGGVLAVVSPNLRRRLYSLVISRGQSE